MYLVNSDQFPASPALTIDAIAAGLIEAHRSHIAWRPESFTDALTIEDAYVVQDAVAAALNWFPAGRPAAWKAGGKTSSTAAPLPCVLPSGGTWHPGAAHELAMEAELAFRLGRTPTEPDDVVDCIDTMCVTIELVGTRLVGGLQAPLPWKLADQQVHAVLIAGEQMRYAQRDWTRQACTIRINGETRVERVGGHPNEDAVRPLPWLVDHARARGMGLCAGDLVTTGAWAVLPVQPGDTIEVEFGGIGMTSVTVLP